MATHHNEKMIRANGIEISTEGCVYSTSIRWASSNLAARPQNSSWVIACISPGSSKMAHTRWSASVRQAA